MDHGSSLWLLLASSSNHDQFFVCLYCTVLHTRLISDYRYYRMIPVFHGDCCCMYRRSRWWWWCVRTYVSSAATQVLSQSLPAPVPFGPKRAALPRSIHGDRPTVDHGGGRRNRAVHSCWIESPTSYEQKTFWNHGTSWRVRVWSGGRQVERKDWILSHSQSSGFCFPPIFHRFLAPVFTARTRTTHHGGKIQLRWRLVVHGIERSNPKRLAVREWRTTRHVRRTQGNDLGFGHWSIHPTLVDGQCGCVSPCWVGRKEWRNEWILWRNTLNTQSVSPFV